MSHLNIMLALITLLSFGCNSVKQYEVFYVNDTYDEDYRVGEFIAVQKAINENKTLTKDEIYVIGAFFFENYIEIEARLMPPKKIEKQWVMDVVPVYEETLNKIGVLPIKIDESLNLNYRNRTYSVEEVFHGHSSVKLLNVLINSFPIKHCYKKLQKTSSIKILEKKELTSLVGTVKFSFLTSEEFYDFIYQDGINIDNFNVGLLNGNQVFILPKVYINNIDDDSAHRLSSKKNIYERNKEYFFEISYLKYFSLENSKLIIFTSEIPQKDYCYF